MTTTNATTTPAATTAPEEVEATGPTGPATSAAGRAGPAAARRRRLPDLRTSYTRTFRVPLSRSPVDRQREHEIVEEARGVATALRELGGRALEVAARLESTRDQAPDDGPDDLRDLIRVVRDAHGEQGLVARVFALVSTMAGLATPREEGTMQMYLTAGVYDDGALGELFIRCDRPGTLARGLLDALGVMISLMLQYGLPLEAITGQLRHMRFEPNGWTGDAEFKMCTSVCDLIAQWLERRFGPASSGESGDGGTPGGTP